MSSLRHLVPLASSSLLILAGCNSIHTRPAELPPPVPVAGNTGSGIPYRLPAGLVTLDFTFPDAGGATDGKIAPAVKLATSHYPDPTSPFLLLPDHSPFFDTHHKITVSNGLISSISTTETSRINEAVLSLVETGINIAKLKATPTNPTAQSDAPGSTADIFLNDHPQPTEAEVAYALQSASGTKLSLDLTSLDSTYKNTPVGSAGLLHIHRRLQPLAPSAAVTTYGKDLTARNTLLAGIYTRALRPYRVEATLILNREELHKLRRQAHERALARSWAEEAVSTQKLNQHTEALKRATKENDQAQADADRLHGKLAALHDQLALHTLTDELRKTRTTARDDTEKSYTAAKKTADAALQELTKIETQKLQTENEIVQRQKQRALLERQAAKYGVDPTIYRATKTTEGTATINATTAPTDPVVLHTISAIVVLPDPETLIRMPITRATFGTTKNTIKFIDGIVTEYDSEQPSSFAGFAETVASIPRAILKGLAGTGSTSSPISGAATGTPPAATPPAATPPATTQPAGGSGTP